MMQRSTSISTTDWFARMEGLNIVLKARDGDTNFRKVKFAVIDTGVDANDAAAAIVTGYYDFVDKEHGIKRDNTGHGTTSVNLISEMCGEADIYALRVFETDEADDGTRELAIKAVEWCITEGMDIACMPCGFYQSDQDLFGKIHEASGKMLIFAAPTNDSNAGEIAYPAQHDAEVFGIFSTNGAVTSSQHLNPSKGPGHYNFAILGEDIVTYTGKEVSGTSLATALAAGLAGQLLEVSRHRDCRIKNDSMMGLKHGMTKVMMAMAVKDGDFYCLKPWMLLPKELRGLVPFVQYPSETQIKEAREHICNKITLALAEI